MATQVHVVEAVEFKNNLGKYIDLGRDVVIVTNNGKRIFIVASMEFGASQLLNKEQYKALGG